MQQELWMRLFAMGDDEEDDKDDDDTDDDFNINVNEISSNIRTRSGIELNIEPYTGFVGSGLTLQYISSGRRCVGIPGFCFRTKGKYYYQILKRKKRLK